MIHIVKVSAQEQVGLQKVLDRLGTLLAQPLHIGDSRQQAAYRLFNADNPFFNLGQAAFDARVSGQVATIQDLFDEISTALSQAPLHELSLSVRPGDSP